MLIVFIVNLFEFVVVLSKRVKFMLATNTHLDRLKSHRDIKVAAHAKFNQANLFPNLYIRAIIAREVNYCGARHFDWVLLCVEQALENLYDRQYKSGRDLWPLS
jgi:hypothetical protein